MKKWKSFRRKVQNAVDGDTLKIRRSVWGSQFIRVKGLNTPEKGERGYTEAKKELMKLKGKTVTLRPKGKSYGRTVAEVIFKRKKLGR